MGVVSHAMPGWPLWLHGEPRGKLGGYLAQGSDLGGQGGDMIVLLTPVLFLVGCDEPGGG